MKLPNILLLLALAVAAMTLGFFFGGSRDKAVPSATPAGLSPTPKPSVALPPPPELLKTCRAIAALDLILSPEWEDRFYSFDSKWAPDAQMASMRDGSGDSWHIVFSDKGWTALRGFVHESLAAGERGSLSAAIRAACPPELKSFTEEAAFDWENTTICYFHTGGDSPWQRANDLTPLAGVDTYEDGLLWDLTQGPEGYMRHAEDYFEQKIPLEIVQHVFDLKPITPEMVKQLNPETDYSRIEDELPGKIGYQR
ncbi:hypothetical protein OJ996_19205 [Luteolibacter sp. GHJ8]|uniref:Uncharacterized protein n=1 Tax=Luteolibacter rhizosphaerae TaxID=2989719 RepID=A0ABT3G794_9BACT|nr:hypothetical protein [Luteolibacter rhizosphaerae]MCW1915723.1 hypothetical protein [Luteolibacter rhizosphaerae]